jgi:hypothetical protein
MKQGGRLTVTSGTDWSRPMFTSSDESVSSLETTNYLHLPEFPTSMLLFFRDKNDSDGDGVSDEWEAIYSRDSGGSWESLALPTGPTEYKNYSTLAPGQISMDSRVQASCLQHELWYSPQRHLKQPLGGMALVCS